MCELVQGAEPTRWYGFLENISKYGCAPEQGLRYVRSLTCSSKPGMDRVEARIRMSEDGREGTTIRSSVRNWK